MLLNGFEILGSIDGLGCFLGKSAVALLAAKSSAVGFFSLAEGICGRRAGDE